MTRDHRALSGGPGPQSLPRKAMPAASPTHNCLPEPGFHLPRGPSRDGQEANLRLLVLRSTGEIGPTYLAAWQGVGSEARTKGRVS